MRVWHPRAPALREHRDAGGRANGFMKHPQLDAALVTKVLGIQDVGVLASMQTLREILCAEPSIQGGKQSKCDLEKELRALAKKGIVLPG